MHGGAPWVLHGHGGVAGIDADFENTAEGHGSDGFHGLMLWTARGLNREHGLLICRFAWPRLGFCSGLYMAEAMVIIAVRAPRVWAALFVAGFVVMAEGLLYIGREDRK
ncbi:hypothetical protein M0R45_036052 [Rubus argutus]|uniref:Uncharacterized protein n=1 Tax=Rubus argutus TaxID=59490 RepID=A0AAW1VWG0_RUBAR